MVLKKSTFSVPANMVLARAQAEAEQFNHNQVAPEHLLLGLIWEEQGAAYRLLKSLGADPTHLEGELRKNLTQVIQKPGEKIGLSESAKQVLHKSMEAVIVLDRPYLGTEHLLIGLLRTLSGPAYLILRQTGITHSKVLAKLQYIPHEKIDRSIGEVPVPDIANIPMDEKLNLIQLFLRISPVFWVLVGMIVLAGMAAYNQWIGTKLSVFLFVTFGWMLSICLHEFGHALAAYWVGDRGSLRRGYLTLNPLRYTKWFLNMGLPILYLIFGGVGLPGGVVYVNYPLIPRKKMRSYVALGGPVMTLLVILILAAPLNLNLPTEYIYDHQAFWGAWAFLSFLQITALVINLIPMPGFDSFGLLIPYFPRFVVAKLNAIAPYLMLVIFLLLFQDTIVGRGFWFLVNFLANALGIDFDLVALGLDLYLFW